MRSATLPSPIFAAPTFAALIFALSLGGGADAAEPFTPADWWAWRDIATPRINAEGSAVVYVETWNGREDDRFRGNLWTVPAGGGAPRRLTDGAWLDARPVWSPDGSRIACLSDRGGSVQLWVHRVEGGAALQVTRTESAPVNVAWSPDGKWLAYTARVPVKVEAPWAPASLLPFLRSAAPRSQLFVVASTGGAPRAIPLGDFEVLGDPAWMPDGQSILVSAALPAGASNVLQGGEIYSVNVQSGERREITRHAGPDELPVPSPDGSRVAWISREPRAQSYVVNKLNVANPDGSRQRTLAGLLDRDVRLPQWSNDSRTVYFLADDGGITRVYSARNDGSARVVLDGPQRLRDFSLADNGRAVAVRITATASAELIIFPVDLPPKPAVLATANSALLGDRELAGVEAVQWPSGGKNIQGWVFKPAHFDASKKYPLLVDVEDSPRAMCGSEFRLRTQIFTARGFVVLCANPRGTPGYGEEFGNLLRTRFPGDDAEDVARGVDFVIAKGYVDPARVSIAGGMLASWAIAQPGRYARAVIRHALADWVTDVAHAVDGIYRAAAWMGAMPWDDPDQYVKHSPVYFAGNIKAATLILAAEGDPGAEELYFALRARKVESALVEMGRARPSRVMLEWDASLAWLVR